MTKIVAFNGSPRKEGNTSILIRHVLQELENEGIKTELVQIAGQRIQGCTACKKCFGTRDGHCIFDDDSVNECIDKMVEADGIILGSPVYFSDVTAEMKALIDRAGFVSVANGGLYQRKVGSAVVVNTRAGGLRTLDSMLHFMLVTGIVVTGFPVIGFGNEVGDVEKDEVGIAQARVAGKNMAWLLKAVENAKGTM